jgi:hypothetical protein
MIQPEELHSKPRECCAVVYWQKDGSLGIVVLGRMACFCRQDFTRRLRQFHLWHDKCLRLLHLIAEIQRMSRPIAIKSHDPIAFKGHD